MTAFSMFATFESAGVQKAIKESLDGLKPFLGVMHVLRFLLSEWLLLSLLVQESVNASNQLNQVVHNTIWVTGHFHLTLATSVVLTYFGAMYWLVPHLTGRKLQKR